MHLCIDLAADLPDQRQLRWSALHIAGTAATARAESGLLGQRRQAEEEYLVTARPS
jgi:hypothetical protein